MKRFFKRSISLIIVLCMIICNVSVFAEETLPYGYSSSFVEAQELIGEFEFWSYYDCGGKYTYSYNDEWLIAKDAYSYNHELAQASLDLALAGTAASDTDLSAATIKAFWDKLGYTYTEDSIHYVDCISNFDYKDDSKDTIGYGFAYKNVEYDGEVYTIICIGIRSIGYGLEWGSNFTMGSSGDHKGFADAAQKVYAGLNEYVDAIYDAMGDTKNEIKIWVSGYSRGAAVTNILGHLLNASGSTKYRPEDTYVYTFESPRTTTDKAVGNYTYDVIQSVSLDDNIFNIVNVNDLVTYAPMVELGFTRYGKDVNLPSQLTVADYYNSSIYSKMVENYNNILKYTGIVTGETAKTTISYGHYSLTKSLLYQMCKSMDSSMNQGAIRNAYVVDTNFQEAIRYILEKFGYGNQDIDYVVVRTSYVKSTFLGGDKTVNVEEKIDIADLLDGDVGISEVYTLINQGKEILKGDNYEIEIHTRDKTTKVTDSDSVTVYITKDFTLEVAGIGVALLDLENDENYGTYVSMAVDAFDIEVPDNIPAVDYEAFGDNVVTAHVPEFPMSFILQDESVVSYSRYNELSVNSNCNVSVKYKGVEVASCAAGVLNESYTNIEAYRYDTNGNIVFLIPNDADYTYTITANAAGTISASITEMDVNTESEIEKVTYNFSASAGSSYTGNFEDGKALTDGSGSKVSPASSVNNEPKSTASISFNQEGYTSMGSVSGNGDKTLGEYVTITATPESDAYTFAGFYYGDTLVSTESSFTFRADQDLELVAKFAPAESIEVSINPTKTEYLEGKDELDLAGGKLKINYTNGSSKTIELSASGVEVTGFDNTKVGNQTITITWRDKVTSFDINIKEKSVLGIAIKDEPTKLEYKVGEELDLSGSKITLSYDNDTTEDIDITEDMVSGFDTLTAGLKTLVVTFKDKVTSFIIEVIDYITGDMNGDEEVTDADAVYLLYNTFFPEEYPLEQDADFNKDGEVTDADAVYLLYYTFFPEEYPLS